MNEAVQLLGELMRLGIKLDVRGDQLAYAPKNRLRGDLLNRLRQHKQELIGLLSGTVDLEEPPPEPVAIPTLSQPVDQKVSIIIPCHNQGMFLESAILSAINQTHAPYEIVVIDDASTDNTQQVAQFFGLQGVRYLRVHCENSHQAKRAGMEVTTGEFVLFLDADNILNRDYLERALRLFDDSQVGVTYGDAWSFGDSEQRTSRRDVLTAAEIARGELTEATALIRRHALVVADPWSRELPAAGLDQQWIYRKLVETGWGFKKHGAILFDRHHASQRRLALKTEFERLLLGQEDVTLFIPLSGRSWAWQALSQFLSRQAWPHSQIRLVLCDTSQNPEFTRQVKEWVLTADYSNIHYFQMSPSRPGLADELRTHASGNLQRVNEAMCRIYNRLRALVETNFCWILEDDIIPPDDVLQKLLQGMETDVASVSAPYRSRFDGEYLIWDRDRPDQGGVHRIKKPRLSETDSPLAKIRGSGFGCLLIRSHLLKKQIFSLPPGELWYDPYFFRCLGDEWRRFVDWSCDCQHLTPGYEERTHSLISGPRLEGPLISVLTPWYHGDRWREQLEQTLCNQTHTHWECLVVADGCDRPEFADPRFRVFDQQHAGISAAINHAFSQSGGEYITWLDQDDRLEPDALEQMLSVLRAHPEWGAVKSPQAYHWPDGRVTVEDFRNKQGGFTRQRMLKDQLMGHPVLVHRDCWVSWNREFNFAADADWGLRLSEQTTIGYQHGKPLYHWMLHGENPSLKENVAQTNDHQRAIRSAKRRRRENPSVAIVLPSLGITGGIRIALELARRLPAVGIPTCVVEPPGRWSRDLKESNGQPFRLSLPTRQPTFVDLRNIPVWNAIPQSADFAIATSWDLPPLVMEHQNRGDGHASWLIQDWEVGWWPQNVTSDPGIDRIVTVSNELAGRLQSEWGRSAQQITSGYDPQQFPNPGQRRKPDSPKVLIPWRDEKRKNPEGTLALMRAIRERLGWEVVVLSGNQPSGRLMEFADCFQVNPPQEQLHQIYRQCTHFVTRSRREGSSVTALEAISQGTLPVVQSLGTEYLSEEAGVRLPLEATEEDYLEALQRTWEEWEPRSAVCLQIAESMTWESVLPQFAEHVRQWARDLY